MKAIFGVTIDPAIFPADGVTSDAVTRFDTSSDKNLVGDRLAALYRDSAEKIAEALVGKLAGTPHACVTARDASDSCASGFVREMAGKAYRRPLAAEEITRHVAFLKAQAKESDGTAAARLLLSAILQSPHFLYRSELGASRTGSKVPLTQHEIASQLSYFVADAPPDPALTAAADRNELTSPAALRPHAERLMKTPTARAKAQGFFRSYFHLTDLRDKEKDPTLYPGFGESLRAALVAETMTFVDKVLFDEGAGLETLFGASYTYANSAVAKHYGLTASGSEFQKLPLPTGRRGILSQPGILSALSNENGTSPVHRGLFLYQTMLCRPVPAPPPDAADMGDKLFDPKNPKASEREKWGYFETSSPACAACHRLFHPVGLGLENFDGIGRYRTSDNGKAIDPSIEATGLGGKLDGKYRDGLELARAIMASPEGHACFALQYTTYAFGRSVSEESERCRLEAVGAKMRDGKLGWDALVMALVDDESFFFRSYE